MDTHDLPGPESAVAEANGNFPQDSIKKWPWLVGLWLALLSMTPDISTRGKPENASFECIGVIKQKSSEAIVEYHFVSSNGLGII